MAFRERKSHWALGTKGNWVNEEKEDFLRAIVGQIAELVQSFTKSSPRGSQQRIKYQGRPHYFAEGSPQVTFS